MKRFITQTLPKIAIVAVVITAALGTSYLYANWSAPTASPPADNVDSPLNTGPVTQIKDAGLNLLSLIVNGPIRVINGSLRFDLNGVTEKKGQVLMSTDTLGNVTWVATSSLGITGSGGGGGVWTGTAYLQQYGSGSQSGDVVPSEYDIATDCSVGTKQVGFLPNLSTWDSEPANVSCTIDSGSRAVTAVSNTHGGIQATVLCEAMCTTGGGGGGGGAAVTSYQGSWCGASGRSTNGANISIDCMGNTLPAYGVGTFYSDGGTQGSCPANFTYMVVGADGNYIGTCVKNDNAPPMGQMANFFHVQDRKSTGINGGDFISGAWRTRILNHVVSNTIGGASLSGNRFTLPTGTYYIEADVPAMSVRIHKAKLRNVTDGTDVIIGTTHHADRGDGDSQSESRIIGTFAVSGTDSFEIQHQADTSEGNIGLGRASGFGEPEIYTNVRIWKVD